MIRFGPGVAIKWTTLVIVGTAFLMMVGVLFAALFTYLLS